MEMGLATAGVIVGIRGSVCVLVLVLVPVPIPATRFGRHELVGLATFVTVVRV